MSGQRPPPTEGEIINAFTAAMQAAGFNPGAIELNSADFVRFDAPGDKRGRQNGYYKIKTGQYPVGWFGDWKSGQQTQWNYFEKSTLSEKEWKHVQAEHRRLKAEAAIEREANHKARAEDARQKWLEASADVAGHAYLERKRIDPPKGLRLHIAGEGAQLVVVPMWAFDQNGNPQIWNLQYIAGDGTKRFMKGGRVDGTFFSLRGSSERNVIVLCEGVATGFTIWRATGLSVMVAFNSGNLVKVARELEQWRPMSDVLIAADDDAMPSEAWLEANPGKTWENAGVKAATQAARAIDCKWIVPHFRDGPDRGRTDFNDLEAREGIEAVGAQIWGAFEQRIVPEEHDDGQPVELRPSHEPLDEGWRSKLPRTASGTFDGGNVDGVAMFVQNHRLLAGRMAFNVFTKDVEVDGAPMQKHHVAEFRRLMHHERYKSRKEDVMDEMEAEARRVQYDPLQDYLAGVAWDRKPRIDNWLSAYLGADPSAYTRAIGAKFLIGAVARARKPGCKNDTMPVLEGPQGIGKSTAIRYLFGAQFFIDDLSDFASKDSFQLIQGAWCCEVAELSAMQKSETADVKKFLSKVQDKYRAPYERAPISVPRRTVFVGTVNPELGSGYLRDSTGARRFWPIECRKIDLRGILSDRDQLWAEAVVRFEAGEKWHLEDAAEVALAEREQLARREIHPWEWSIREYLLGCGRTTIADLLANAIKLTVDKRDSRASRTVGGILRGMGWEAVDRGDGGPMQEFQNPAYIPDARAANDGTWG